MGDTEPLQGFVRMRIQDASIALGVVPKTVYYKANKYGWKREQDAEGRGWVWIPEELLPAPTIVEATPIIHDVKPDVTQDVLPLLQEVKQLYDERLRDKDTVIQLLQSQLEAQTHQITSLNTAIQKYKAEPTPSEILAAIQSKKQWWKFW